MVHTNGDAAVEMALEAMEEILPGYGTNDLRHRFEHVSFTTDDQLARLAKAGISPSFLMNHVYFWGAAFRDTILGPERAQRLDRVASAYAAGMRPSLHSDYTVTEIHPLLSARTARELGRATRNPALVAAANQVPYIAFRSLSDLAGAEGFNADVGALFASGLAETNEAEVTLSFLRAWTSPVTAVRAHRGGTR